MNAFALSDLYKLAQQNPNAVLYGGALGTAGLASGAVAAQAMNSQNPRSR